MAITRSEIESYRRQLAVDAAAAAVSSLAINASLREGSIPQETANNGNGYYTYDENDVPVYHEYFKAGDVAGVNAVVVVR